MTTTSTGNTDYICRREDPEAVKWREEWRLMDEFMATLDTREKLLEFLVGTGIYNSDGTLTEVFRDV